jgi:hypothetical protein
MFHFFRRLSFKRTNLETKKKKSFQTKREKHMVSEEAIADEWAKVQYVPSLRKHYGADYPKWHQRFVRNGYLVPSPRTSAEKRQQKRRDYARKYYKQWRATIKDKVRETQLRYYRKVLMQSAS